MVWYHISCQLPVWLTCSPLAPLPPFWPCSPTSPCIHNRGSSYRKDESWIWGWSNLLTGTQQPQVNILDVKMHRSKPLMMEQMRNNDFSRHWPCLRLLLVLQEIQQGQADPRGPALHHVLQDQWGLSLPSLEKHKKWETDTSRSASMDRIAYLLWRRRWNLKKTHRNTFLSSRSRGSLRAWSARWSDRSSSARLSSLTRRALEKHKTGSKMKLGDDWYKYILI